MITVSKFDEAFAVINCSPNEMVDLENHFSFFAKDYQFSPRYRKKKWDGKIRLLSGKTGKILFGLVPEVFEYAEWKGYAVDAGALAAPALDIGRVEQFWKTIPTHFQPRDYQQEAFDHCIAEERAIIIAPTGSGKSFLLWLLSEFYKGERVLIIVPSVALVHQMAGDFGEYGGNPEEHHLIYTGQEKFTKAPIVISTWQSLTRMPKTFFRTFRTVVVDEVHTAHAASLKHILTMCSKASRRFGCTGSLDDCTTHKLVIEGLFGPIHVVRKTHELIEDEVLAEINIEAVVLKHEPRDFASYQEEIAYICGCEKRNRLLVNLAASRSGNTLLLFNYIEKHGQILYDLLSGMGKKVLFFHGSIDGDVRDEMRKVFEAETGVIGVGSYGTCQQGINITNLHNIIIGSPVKSQVRVKQSIGRGTRRDEATKLACAVYHLADDFRQNKYDESNYTLNHFRHCLLVYAKERFPVKLHSVRIG